MTVEQYLSLPWTIERTDEVYDGEHSVELRVKELPGFVVVSETAEDAEARFWPAFRLFLSSYIEDGDELPRPVPSRIRIVDCTFKDCGWSFTFSDEVVR